MAYRIEWEARGVVKRYTGHVSREEFTQSVLAIAADRRFDDLRFILNDLREVRSHDIDTQALEDVAVTRLGSMHSNPNLRVLVVASEPSLVALVEAAQRPPLADTYPTVLFPSETLARAWLARQPALRHSTGRG